MVDTCLSPMVKPKLKSPRPQTSLPASSPRKPALTVTFVPGCQKSFGRQCTSVGANQCQAPTVGGTAWTVIRCTTAACRSGGIGLLNRRMTGIPTPTVLPSAGCVDAVSRPAVDSVVKPDFEVDERPLR